MKKTVRVLLYLITAVLVCVIGYSGYHIGSQLWEYHKSNAEYENIREYAGHSSGEDGNETAPALEFIPQSDQPGITWSVVFPDVNFDKLLEKNPDTVGWIYCPETHIDYPVVRGEDNDYYLHRSFERIYSGAGCIFMDAENSPDMTDFNTILYGHHMKNGSMFRDLDHYKDQDYYKAHPFMLYLTPEKKYVVQIFAGFVANAYDDSWTILFENDEAKQEWLDARIERSAFDGIITPAAENHIITLSTCSYEFSNARFVVYGILTEVNAD